MLGQDEPAVCYQKCCNQKRRKHAIERDAEVCRKQYVKDWEDYHCGKGWRSGDGDDQC